MYYSKVKSKAMARCGVGFLISITGAIIVRAVLMHFDAVNFELSLAVLVFGGGASFWVAKRTMRKMLCLRPCYLSEYDQKLLSRIESVEIPFLIVSICVQMLVGLGLLASFFVGLIRR